MIDFTRLTSPYNAGSDRNLDSTTKFYGPLVLAALYRVGVRDADVPVHLVLAAILAERNLGTMTWGELCAIAVEALAMARGDARRWRGRAYALGLGSWHAAAEPCWASAEAVADEALYVLAGRLIRDSLSQEGEP